MKDSLLAPGLVIGVLIGIALTATHYELDKPKPPSYRVDIVGNVGYDHWEYKFHDTETVCASVSHWRPEDHTVTPYDWHVSLHYPGGSDNYALPTFTSADFLAWEHCGGFIKPWKERP